MVVLPVPCIQVVVVWQVTVVRHGCLDCFCKAGWGSFGLFLGGGWGVSLGLLLCVFLTLRVW